MIFLYEKEYTGQSSHKLSSNKNDKEDQKEKEVISVFQVDISSLFGDAIQIIIY